MATFSKHTGFDLDGAKLTEAAHLFIKQFENIFLDINKKHKITDFKKITKVVSHISKKYPIALMSSTMVTGILISFLLSKYFKSHDEEHRHFFHPSKKNGLQEDISKQIRQMLQHVMGELQEHSAEICDTVLGKYIKNKPLPAMGTALAAALLLNFLSRR